MTHVTNVITSSGFRFYENTKLGRVRMQTTDGSAVAKLQSGGIPQAKFELLI